MTAQPLGETRQEFKPGLENLIAGIMIGLLMIAAGCAAVLFPIYGVIENGGALPLWTKEGQKEWSWGAAGIFGALGIGLIVGALFLIWWVRSLFSLRVRVAQNGFSVIYQTAARDVRWEDILSVQEIHLYQRPPVLKGVAKYALPKMRSKSFVVKMQQGEPFAFDGDTIKGHSRLAAMIKEETDRRNIPWEVVEKHVD
jgi:hypothetical protein